MEQVPRVVQIKKSNSTYMAGKNRGTSLQELFESIYNKRNGGISTDGWDGEPYDHDSEPDDCYCE